MIGSIRGVLLERSTSGELLIEAAGVGYRVMAPPAAAGLIGDLRAEVFVHVHHHIREDNQALYGFPSREERVAFEALLGAHGVGPSLAMAILSVHGPSDLARVLANDDIAALTLVPGVGKKTATRLLVELKSRLDLPELDLANLSEGDRPEPGAIADVQAALAGLGYSTEEIRSVLRDVPPNLDSSELLKEALQRLASAGA